MLKLLLRILKDERGIAWGAIGGGMVEAGSTVSDYLGSRKRGDPPQPKEWPGVGNIQQAQSKNIASRIGQPREFGTNPAFQLPIGEVEQETQKAIAGGLKDPATVSGYSKDITDKAYGARKARLGERHKEEISSQQDMYNRLGLVSSTPGLQAETDLRRKQGLELEDVSAQLSYEDIQREMDAKKLVEDITQSRIGKGQEFSAFETGKGQFEQGMTMEDLLRQLAEEGEYGAQASRYLSQGGVSPEAQQESDLFKWAQPNVWNWLSSGARNTMAGAQSGGTGGLSRIGQGAGGGR